ncbi:MAG: serpin family protein [Nitriliruptorales bacterium]|nr:serpin family protein [Nitriliruptorales bacterium]
MPTHLTPPSAGPDPPGAEGQLLTATVDRADPEGADVDALVDGMTRFGLELFGQVAEPGANVVVSPPSIAVAFGMARAGAAGTTAEEIDAVLRFPPDAATTHSSFNALDRLLAEAAPADLGAHDPEATRSPEESAPPALAIANGVFPQIGFPVREQYLSTLAAQYGAGVVPVDFTAPDRATRIIDAWVREQTRERIDRLFDDLDPTTVLVLANAVYLKADWLRPFAERPTEELPFTLADGSHVGVPTMSQRQMKRYAQGDGWQAVELPYTGGRLAMWVLVPSADRTPSEVLTPGVLAAVDGGLAEGIVDLHMPRWAFDTDVELIPVLRALGMQAPFTGFADFSGITHARIWIGDAIHRATITVDEWGTEAAAVTGLAFVTSFSVPPPDAVIHADRPFAIVILDTQVRLPLFLGQVADPS